MFDVSPGLNGLAVLAFVQYLKRKGIVVTHLCVSECFGSRKQQPRQFETTVESL